jgi:hypothetical protein
MTRLPRDKSGLLLTVTLHLALLWAMLARPVQHSHSAPDEDRPAIQWLRALPAALPPAEAPPAPSNPPAAAPRNPTTRAGSPSTAPLSAVSAISTADPALQAAPGAAPAAALTTALAAETAADPAPAAVELLRKGRQQAGAIDKALRNGKALPLQAGTLRQGKLDQTFDEASIASRKWYHAPQIRELGVPMTSIGGDRVYEVKNAGGRYCIYHPADGSPHRTKECPREK